MIATLWWYRLQVPEGPPWCAASGDAARFGARFDRQRGIPAWLQGRLVMSAEAGAVQQQHMMLAFPRKEGGHDVKER